MIEMLAIYSLVFPEDSRLRDALSTRDSGLARAAIRDHFALSDPLPGLVDPIREFRSEAARLAARAVVAYLEGRIDSAEQEAASARQIHAWGEELAHELRDKERDQARAGGRVGDEK